MVQHTPGPWKPETSLSTMSRIEWHVSTGNMAVSVGGSLCGTETEPA